MEKFDEDQDGKLTFREFIKSVSENNDLPTHNFSHISIIRMIEEIENESMAPKEEIDMIVRAFENHDLNKDGYLTKEELKTFIQKMGKIQSISPLIRAMYIYRSC